MRRARTLIIALAVSMIGIVFAPATPAAAAIDDVQQASWGLATFGNSRAVDNFSALGWAVEEAAGAVYVGGNFLDVTNGSDTERQPYFASFDLNTGAWRSSFTPDVGGPVLAIEPAPDGDLFVGGEMDTWNGVQIGALAKVDPVTGDVDAGFAARLYGGTSVVRDLSLGPDGWLYAVGSFTTASSGGNPQTVYDVVRMNPTSGAIDFGWVPVTGSGGVWGVSRSYTQDTVYLAGWNNTMNGNPVVGVSASNASQVVWDDFVMNYGCCDHMYDIQATPWGTVLAVGEQHGAYLYDENANWNQIIGHTTAYNSRYQDSSIRRGGDYQDIELVGDELYVSCHCWGSHHTGNGYTPTYAYDMRNVNATYTGPVSSTVIYDAQTGVRDQSFSPYMAGDIGGWGVLVASDGCVWIAGGINAVGPPGNQSPGRDLVRLCEEGYSPPPPAGPASCTATIGVDGITVEWTSVAGAADYVIYRSVDGGQAFWRGTATGNSFTDSPRSGTLQYFVAAKSGNQLSAQTACTTVDGTPDPVAPASCLATRDGTSIAVTWPAGENAADYVVWRSVDGGQFWWRGTSTTTSFTDSDRSGTIVYQVAARAADGTISARTDCTTEGGPGGGGDTERPSTPTALGVDAVWQQGTRLTWTGSTDNVAVAGYDVYDADTGQVVATASGAGTTRKFVGNLTTGQTYRFYVKAFDEAGNSSWRSNIVTVTPGT